MTATNAQPGKAARPMKAVAAAMSGGSAGAADTPAERRKRKVRDSIIEAAEDVFALEGEAGLSMRRLADRIDYSPAAIYKYFASKDELLWAIREQFFERLLAQMQEARAAGLTDQERFAAALRAYVQTGLDNPNHYRMAFANMAAPAPKEGTRCYEAAVAFTALIEELMTSGAFRKLDPRLASTSLWASLHGLTSLMASIPDFPHCVDEASAHITKEALIESHVDLLYRGLARA
jgi:AcrR family transcriptional regulator